MQEDVNTNKTMARHGADHILNHFPDQAVKILTHCNTGSLATAGYGTALGKATEYIIIIYCVCKELHTALMVILLFNIKDNTNIKVHATNFCEGVTIECQ